LQGHLNECQIIDEIGGHRKPLAVGFPYTEKVRELMEDGWFCEEDIERCIETGDVCKKQKDEMGNAADGWKYTILGIDCSGAPFYCAGKIMRGEEGNFFLVITAHERKGS
jgi:hypothetical protein